MRENTTKIRNIKQYLKAVLFNAPSTIDSYYTALVNHDFYGSKYIDCVLIPDHASDRVGAVLFRNDKEQSSNVAFFDADGYFQQYGTYARMSDEPDFQYLGGGAVTFKLETEDGIIYNYTITISIDGSNVNFKAEDDLPK